MKSALALNKISRRLLILLMSFKWTECQQSWAFFRPIFGIGVAFGFSRQLRKRIKRHREASSVEA
jgi:hypothetical protein